MKVLLVHITDIHVKKNTNLDLYTNSFCRTILNQSHDITKIYFIISGDLVFSGKNEEFLIFDKYLNSWKMLINSEKPAIEFKFIIVPGNHDCNFDKNNQIRDKILPLISYEFIGVDNNDDSVINTCLNVQEDFWEYYKKYNEVPKNKLYYILEDKLEKYKLVFHCLNTSWVSSRNETTGSLFLPIKQFIAPQFSPNTVNVAVWHHPTNWLNPNTNENNKSEFEKFIETFSVLNLFGHEHYDNAIVSKNLKSNVSQTYLAGEVFNENKPANKNKSGFQIIKIDLETNLGKLIKYHWHDTLYSPEEIVHEIALQSTSNESFLIKEPFLNSLKEIKIPLVLEYKKNICLPDIYVWPDFEPAKKSDRSFESYVNSKNILGREENLIIDGESQIGKTSFLNMSFLELLDSNVYPILLNGSMIELDFDENSIKKTFINQYKTKNSLLDFTNYEQLPKKNKAILIEDFQNCKLSFDLIQDKLNFLTNIFGKVILVVDSSSSMWINIGAEFDNFKYYTIKSLGYRKRNELIERFYSLNKIENKLQIIKETFDNVQSVLGDKLMPAYPVFILSILQSLQYTALKSNETSSAYCYQTLIHFSLRNVEIKPDDIDGYFNFLVELAFHFIEKDVDFLELDKFKVFYSQYEQKYITPDYTKFIDNLKRSKILKFENDSVKFGYNYILYYLSAKKISDLLPFDEGKKMTEFLFTKLHIEKYANILIFITHHSKDISFIENSMLNAMVILDNQPPITLQKSDNFYSQLSTFIVELKEDIIDLNKNPIEVRENELKQKDEFLIEKERNTKTEDYSKITDEVDEIFLPFLKAFRSIEIIGQIIKNRKGSLEKTRLTELITEVYITGFRTTNYLLEILEKQKNELIDLFNTDEKRDDKRFQKSQELQNKINELIQMFCFKLTFMIFTKLTHSLGHKDLKLIYSEVANQIGTPAAKIVTFYINSYYNTIHESDLKLIAKEFKGNIVAMKYLRAIVTNYVYNRELKQQIKQSFASILEMNIKPFNNSNIHKIR